MYTYTCTYTCAQCKKNILALFIPDLEFKLLVYLGSRARCLFNAVFSTWGWNANVHLYLDVHLRACLPSSCFLLVLSEKFYFKFDWMCFPFKLLSVNFSPSIIQWIQTFVKSLPAFHWSISSVFLFS